MCAKISCLSGRWQAPAAVLPKGPKDKGDSHSRARRAREWLKHASPRARRARGRAKPSARFGACQCYYMFFTIQPKIAIFMGKFKYFNDGQNAWKFQQSFISTIWKTCKKMKAIRLSEQKLFEVEIPQNCGVCVKKGYDNIYPVSRGHIFPKSHPCLSGHNFGSIKDTGLINTSIDRYLLDLSKNVL